jgi:hypothetical protein
MVSDIWGVLNSHTLNIHVTILTLYYTGFFFLVLGIFMAALGPRDPVERGFTWIIWAVVMVIVRSLAIRLYQRPLTELWGTAVWLNLAASITYTLWSIGHDPDFRKRLNRLTHGKRGNRV